MSKVIISKFIENGFLVSPEFLDKNDKEDEASSLLDQIKIKLSSKDNPIVLGQDLLPVIYNDKKVDINWLEFDSSKALYEKGRNGKTYQTFLDIIIENKPEISLDKPFKKSLEGKESSQTSFSEKLEQKETQKEKETGNSDDKYRVHILKSYDEPPKKRTVQDFVTYFRLRYEGIKKILLNRTELQNATSISRIIGRNGHEPAAIIGIVSEKRITKNGSIIFNLEDLTGSITAIISKGNSNGLIDVANDVVDDEVIGLTGFVRDKAIFANSIIWPDVPLKELKKAKDECYVAFISDIHVGSKKFLFDEFMKFVRWINGGTGDEKQREVALKIKYLFVIGDIIDGCGVFPGQEDTLAIKDIEKQYDACAAIFAQIRKDIKIIMCPGQHDSLRSSEPQPTLYKDFARKLYELENVVMVSNPALVNIHASKEFPGFDVLMYHGASFHYFISNVDSVRRQDPKNNPSVVSKFLLKRRHLAPTYGSVGILPDTKSDSLIIDKVPDFFVNGDMHRTNIGNYNGVAIINSSCWQDRTEFEEKVGNNPDPAKVPIVNLKTRETTVLDFSN